MKYVCVDYYSHITNLGSMKKILNIILISCFSLIVISCAKKDSSSSSSTTTTTTISSLQYIDIIDAESLFIVPGSSSSRSVSRSSYASSTTNTLFKITETGAVQEVGYKDEDNNTYTVTSQPVSIDNVDTNYVVFSFGSDKINPTECYLTNKSTGAVYLLGSAVSQLESKCPVPQFDSKDKMILSDNKSNFYYHYYAPISGASFYYLRQVNYTDPTSISASQYIIDSESVNRFIVDSNGNVAYTAYTTAGYANTAVNRIRKSNGGYYNLDIHTSYWIGLDGNIYLEALSDEVKKVSIDSDYNVSISSYDNITASCNCRITNQHYKLKLSNKLIFVKPGDDSTIAIDNGTEIRTLDLPLSKISIARSSSNYAYISGTDNSSSNTVLVKFNPSDNSSSQMYTKGTYDIYNFNVTSDDNITFSALRMNDGKKVLGKILADGTLSITDESINKQITILERIR